MGMLFVVVVVALVQSVVAFQGGLRATSSGLRRLSMMAAGKEAFQLVLIRHGESTWNQENKFTGWYDCPLSEKGHTEAAAAGKLLKEGGFKFDIAYTSYLKRAIRTLWHTLEQTDLMYIPVKHSWELNERHYGGLQGLDKAATVAKYGEEQVPHDPPLLLLLPLFFTLTPGSPPSPR